MSKIKHKTPNRYIKAIKRTKKCFYFTYYIILLIVLNACNSTKYVNTHELFLADTNATTETKLLYKKIEFLSHTGISIGHQDATAYGVHWKASEKNKFKSDIEDVIGKYPAIQGWDVGNIELGHSKNLDSVSFDLMKKQIIRNHEKGGFSTISWHLDNPATDGDSWDTTPAVSTILDGGANRDKYLTWIDRLGDFFKSLKTKNGELAPVVFRPFHEMNGAWFWWGTGNCSIDKYKTLFRDIVDQLKNRNVHNLLYSYSPNTLNNNEEYGLFYPGDEYVDIVGIDIYNHSGDKRYTEALKNDISVMKSFAQTHRKLYALTETGNIKIKSEKWWTEVLYPGIEKSGIAWILLWRNDSQEHYFAPYPNEISVKDFKKLSKQKDILLLKDIKKYKFKPLKQTN
ncbi:glycosyl hydrolase [Galbibacter sp. EGI 63066]|uniref:glycoside hydrolase family 26 protein n=1 Tax=Galbibacter sp. EGI 63066 TaxID=2993559 RepID=UPI0022499738|nr:glycosyl hydrolase [Galbibacter sp. EGI 63066]MCX2678605.1 glycosyl hydrolase [Galbibacter sp. EGI 63066]